MKPRTVEFRLSGKLVPDAKQVCLAGLFNRWDTSVHRLTKGPDGDWTITVTLAPGTYPYLIFVDGVWYNDPGDDGRVPSEWGREYSLKIVR